MREIHFHSVLRTRELEIQYHMAQHDKLRKAQDAELNKSHQLTRQVSTFSQTENELRNQLNIYVEKFKQVAFCVYDRHPKPTDGMQVEDTLNNSNDLFLTFRKEMEEMSKKTKRLEKENMQLTRKQEATNRNIFQMAEERTSYQKDLDRVLHENDKLKKLCRAMQTNGYNRAESEGHDPEDGELGDTDSEYDAYEGEDSIEGEYDEDTEEEPLQAQQQRMQQSSPVPQQASQPRAFGPAAPAVVDVMDTTNGAPRVQTNGVNGIHH